MLSHVQGAYYILNLMLITMVTRYGIVLQLNLEKNWIKEGSPVKFEKWPSNFEAL